MNRKSPTHATLTGLISALAAMAVGKILELPSVRGGVRDLDSRVYKQQRDLSRSLKRGVKNAKSNIPWLAAGVVVIIVGVGLVAKASRGK